MTLNEIEQRLSALKSEQDKLTAELERLKSEKSEVKPWRAEYNSIYYFVRGNGTVGYHYEEHDETDNRIFRSGNYYRTKELAEQDAKELALRGRIRQLRDALCEGYQFVSGKDNFYIFINGINSGYSVSSFMRGRSIGEVYFDTREHAQQACDILNVEAHNGT